LQGMRGMKDQARLAAMWSLNVMLDSPRNFYLLCTCFANMMITAHVFQNKYLFITVKLISNYYCCYYSYNSYIFHMMLYQISSSKDRLQLYLSFTRNCLFLYRSIIFYLENKALNFCAKARISLEYGELKGIAKIYAGVFFLRWSRGNIPKAISIGFITARLAQTLDSTFLKILTLPKLAHLLMISCRNSEAVTLLRELGKH